MSCSDMALVRLVRFVHAVLTDLKGVGEHEFNVHWRGLRLTVDVELHQHGYLERKQKVLQQSWTYLEKGDEVVQSHSVAALVEIGVGRVKKRAYKSHSEPIVWSI